MNGLGVSFLGVCGVVWLGLCVGVDCGFGRVFLVRCVVGLFFVVSVVFGVIVLAEALVGLFKTVN